MKNKAFVLWLLYFLTIVSVFWAGVVEWWPPAILERIFYDRSVGMTIRQMLLANGGVGAIFCASLLAILTAHELGHYFMARRYNMKATPPIFLPFPLNPIGTCGAVIAMQKNEADRKQLFDIGIAGPLAGLVVIIPVLLAGLLTDFGPQYKNGTTCFFSMPLLVQLLDGLFQTRLLDSHNGIANTEMNPFLMAAWAGLLVTGMNMVPMSQLDGGHVALGLLGRKSYYISYFAFGCCIAYIVFMGQWMFALMLLLVYFLGIQHPPSSDDDIPLGWFRVALGWTSLVIPILCVPITPIRVLGP